MDIIHALARIAARIVALAVALLAVLVALAAPAHAQTGVPIGEFVAATLDFWEPVAVAAVLWLFRKLPRQLYHVLVALRVEQLIGPAVRYGINATKGAAPGAPVTLPIGNEVVAMALAYAREHAPQLVEAFGLTRVREKIIARLEFEADAAVPPPAASVP